tara:strand:- start:135 stop:878 length:744 start_codon:yes stop_codon:yes gene_type:complete
MIENGRYYNDREKIYHEKRKDFISKYSSEDIAENPMLFASYNQITEFYTTFKIFELCKDISGDIVECGVFCGNSLMLYAHLLENLQPYVLDKKIIGFDTFDGFDDSFINKDKDKASLNKITSSMFKDTDYERLNQSIKIHDSRRALGHIEKIKLVKGDACKTIRKYVEENQELVISLLYIDFDLYEPTKIALEYLYPCVPKGGIVVFDEFSYSKYPGETIAVKETIGLNHSFKKIPGVPFKSYFIKE